MSNWINKPKSGQGTDPFFLLIDDADHFLEIDDADNRLLIQDGTPGIAWINKPKST